MLVRAVRNATLAVALVLSSFDGSAQGASNPILPNADPFITLNAVQGRYLLLATAGRNITIWSGPTVQTAATKAKVVFSPTDGLTQIWSPTIWKMGTKWWIYFTARAPGKEHTIYVLESETSDPLGNYISRGALDLGRPAIDPSLLTVRGVNYLMYVTVDRGENAIYMEPTYAWEKGAGGTRNYPVNEGPTALYHKGHTFIVYSGSDTASPKYCLGILSFKSGDPLDKNNWTKTDHPVFEASPENGIYGPGRGTFAHSSDGSNWLVYAAKSTDAPTAADRQTRAQRFTWNTDATPNFGIPLKDNEVSIR